MADMLCPECFQLDVPGCGVFRIPISGYSIGDYLWLEMTDKFGNKYLIRVQVHGDTASTWLVIDPDDFPEGIFTMYSGSFNFKLIGEGETMPVMPICEYLDFTFCEQTYQCLNVTITNTEIIGATGDPSCDAATVTNDEDAPTYVQEVGSGLFLVLPQLKILDSDQLTTIFANYIPNTQGFAAQCSPVVCADGTARNSNNSYSAPVPSGGILPLPNIDFTDSTGVVTSVPSVQDIVATPAPTVTVSFFSDPALTVPAVAGVVGQTIYVRVNSFNLVPTSHTFFIPQRNGTFAIVTQPSNVYNWMVNAVGVLPVVASSSNGTLSPLGVGSITITSSYILDTYVTATAAFSVRRVRSAYVGSCINVRRSSDNAQTDIGFVNDMLDVATLTAFVGSGNGFVTTWYDQSTTASNATQVVAANQPMIVSDGVVSLRNGIPSIIFGLLNGAYSSFNLTNRTVKTLFSFWKKNTNNIQYNTLLGWAADYTIQCGGSTPTLTVESPGGNIATSLNNFKSNALTVLLGTLGTGRVRANAVQIATGTSSDTQVLQRIGVNTFSTARFYNGEFQELITFPDNQSANFAAIESNQMTYFGQ